MIPRPSTNVRCATVATNRRDKPIAWSLGRGADVFDTTSSLERATTRSDRPPDGSLGA